MLILRFFVNLSGKVMFVKKEQSRNALSPIVVNPSGKAMFVKEEQPLNADSPILLTKTGTMNSVPLPK